jgi:hypothetical protein
MRAVRYGKEGSIIQVCHSGSLRQTAVQRRSRASGVCAGNNIMPDAALRA